ncbi:cilia- and flagella- associated protein 210-like [Hydractinia symbiolongicarpus]|uniref:cilia- and flagella- associated protein 210-like n=1 Tax=Hydractinia symbiolongicarpus TaxID=13093 RepID=UPI00254B1C5C|nr:cilia- and flagella- associated protein 210-like [Hydractinia symbiolongicarpus]
MSTIMYGRRGGMATNKMMTEFPRVGLMAQGINPRDVAVFQPKDWQRIQNSLTKYNREAEEHAEQKREREKLHAKSKKLVKNWENTIEGQRLKKLQARKIREEQEELERQEIDIAEAKLQAEKRKEAIQRAKQLQYYDTDRVKGFHGALLLTEVLKERDAQIEMKKAKSNWRKERETHALALQKKNYKDAIRADLDKAQARFSQSCEVSNFQRVQVKNKEQNILFDKQKDIEEGKTIEQQYKAFCSAKAAIAAQERHSKTVLMNNYQKEIMLKKEKEEQEKMQEKIEDEKNKKFVNAKRKMTKMRKEKENELFEAFQNHTEKMRQQLQQEMQQRVDDEDDRIAKAVAEREAKRMAEEERKQREQKETLTLINEHRIAMINEAERIGQENQKRDKSLLKERIKEDRQFHKSVIEDKAKQRVKAAELQNIRNNQKKARALKVQEEFNQQLERDKKNTELLVQEEEIFQEYATKVIEDAKRGERNPFPLIKAKNEGPGGGRGPKFEGNAGLRPSYIVADATGVQLPHYMKDEAVYYQSYGHVGKSGKRLGFTW